MPSVILLFAKAPIPGRVKTRLQPVLSATEAAELHTCFVGDVLESLEGFNDQASIELHLDQPTLAWNEFPNPRKLQQGDNLGARMWNAAHEALAQNNDKALILGSDAPTLPKAHLHFLLHSQADLSFGPTEDGGYYAIAFRRVPAGLFDGVEWSTEQTLAQSIAAVQKLGLSVELGPLWYDIDSPADLVRLVTEPLPSRTRHWLEANQFLVAPPAPDI